MSRRRSAAVAYERRIDDRLDEISQQIAVGDTRGAVAATTRVLTGLNTAVQRYDSSNGFLNRLFDRAAEVHRQAVAADPPRPTRLAEVLWRLAHLDPLDAFVHAYPAYADALSAQGRAQYRALAREAFDALPPPQGRWDSAPGAFTSTAVLRTIALHDRDVDLLEHASSRALVHPYGYVRLIQGCVELGRLDRAVHWAQQAADAFPPGAEPRLDVAVVEAMLAAGQVDQALGLARTHLLASPTPQGWQALCDALDAADLDPAARTRLREEILGQVVADAPPDRAVAILLEVGDVERAWATAESRGADSRTWQQLAEAMEPTDPARAAQVWQERLERALTQTTKAAYNRVTALLLHLRQLYAAAGYPEEFERVVADVRTAHARRTSLLRRLDDAGL